MRDLWPSKGGVINEGHKNFGQVKEGQLDVRFWPSERGVNE